MSGGNIDDLFNVFEENGIEDNISTKDEAGGVQVDNHPEGEVNEENVSKMHTDKGAIGDEIHCNEENERGTHPGEGHTGRDEEGDNNGDAQLNKQPKGVASAPIGTPQINVENLISCKKRDQKVQNKIKEEIYNDIQMVDGTTRNASNKVRKLNENQNEKNAEKGEKQTDESGPVEETLIENSKTINNDDVLVLEEFRSDVNCIHKCIRPKSYVHNKLSETLTPARTYKFELDTFQKKSIECLERNESVLVSAHTSAGKTVIAEYAIALGLRDKQRVIYTSPIKALSNQKYRDLSEEFKDVGLITGDISINPDASIIVMTTEILRSMLYRGSSLTKEVKWVIFDEIHYMRDRDRGVIWEETIILLPLMVRFIFLSATIPNGIQFAEWVSSIKSQACHIVYTDYRPTPLQHYIYPTSSESVFLICDENKDFKKNNFIKAVNAIKEKNNMSEDTHQQNGNSRHNRRTKKNVHDIEKIVQMCHSRNYTPLIIFAFSKKECEVNATTMHKVDLTDDTEKEVIKELYENAIQILADDDRALPQVQFILPLLLRGIGIHHGGLLPIIKEIIEIMFQESLLKVLFSTETFSMGINMPAKTVVFTSLRKFDGVEKRLITSGEYIQMAGRAGRRGLDDRGIVIIMLDSPLHWREAEKLFVGEANRLVSQFHLGYNMILNLLRIEGITPEFMIERSFIQYQMKKSLFQKILAKKKVEEKIKEIFNQLTSVYLDKDDQEISKGNLLKKIMDPNYECTSPAGEEMSALQSVYTQHGDQNSNMEEDLSSGEKAEITINEEDIQEKEGTHSEHTLDTMNDELKNYNTVFSCISNYYILRNKLIDLGETYRSILTARKNITPYLAMGRLLYLVEDDLRWGWAICIEGKIVEQANRGRSAGRNNALRSANATNTTNPANAEDADVLLVDCLVPYSQNRKRKRFQGDDGDVSGEDDVDELPEGTQKEFVPATDRMKAKWKLITFHIKCIYQISAVVLNLEKPFDKKNEEQIMSAKMKYNTMVKCLKGEKNIPVINPHQMEIKDEAFLKVVKNINYHEQMLSRNKLLNSRNLHKYYQLYNMYVALQFEKNLLEANIEKCRFIVLKKELKNMLVLLQGLNYIEISHNLEGENAQQGINAQEINMEKVERQEIKGDQSTYQNELESGGNFTREEEKSYVVTMKGQIASAILSVDELVISELFFSNFFSKYNYDYICAFLSCFVYDESTNKEVAIEDPILVEGYEQIIRTATHVSNKMNECGMSMNLKDYLDKFKSAIMPIVLQWVRGYSFMEILTDSQIYEGSIIRTLRRLDELLRQMICAFRGINNDSMCEILTEATKKLRRGIPFSPSLYL
ncbi:ATP-dependant RNA helicase, putative [Plasmodium knowlesi strain H]|uniref:ATP-dependant RNA helicase, putative n=3 Tax=Plasmodium knowlesi TaxID=5850 RepID=A0A5K1VRP3_PLAKH|nr:ATP-dependent RNA helicase, putative [Plasmodium knowlesi strain H]OTN64567.1 putative ATP-dependent RNA helicase [Plasmodium knowlesi]CAA9989313.1 ATP-dependent RNA helicase, putative [Plasmodium knowlesi strain H]SBO26112.1 ATP-dependant RNA helicase, putative [Plasmodium knowlesi strain H]SBO26768.1 ATP-dependant RNA helicase, putative [Plasmodium knowlesi strain H]VVS78787.1 ATP-dependent RNA helicase, putative [Plasmodium knowlesi strain H]|eukprot:XP_002261660.1 ATP-dependant RNA helicase, putative [Plasmodium knowlesi strain H]